MPYVRRRRVNKKKPMQRKRRQQAGYRSRRLTTKQSQVFSETIKCGTECIGVSSLGEVAVAAGTIGQGVKLVAQINTLAQAGEYSKLQNAYKILKVKFTLIPKWRGETYNEAALGTAAAIGITETPRFAQAINDMADAGAPAGELDVLKDNGCRIKQFVRPMSITIRPKPLLQQIGGTVVGLPNVNVYQNRGQWLSFDGAGSTVPHIGVDGWFTAVNSLSTGFLSLADVYATVSFVCKDPR